MPSHSAFASLRVLDVSDGAAGAMCAKLFADYGADVVKVEPPEGDPLRARSPLHDPERSPLFLYLNTNKRSIALDLQSRPGRDLLAELITGADVLVESFPLGASPAAITETRKLLPSLVHVSITPFGRTGPYRGFKGNNFTSLAAGGLMYITGDPRREPLATGGCQAEYMAGLNAFLATLAALRLRDVGAGGCHIDVSMTDCIAANLEYTVTMYTYMGAVRRRWFGRHHFGFPHGEVYACQDGHVVVCTGSGGLPDLALLIGRPELAEDPLFGPFVNRVENEDAFQELVRPWFCAHSKYEASALAQELRIPASPVLDAAELLKDEHLRERRFFVSVEHPRAGALAYPGAPFRMSRTPWRAGRAPLLGEHNGSGWAPRPHGGQARPPCRASSSPLPLAGVRVLDLTMVYAGPTCTRLLADMGAEVIKVEAVQRPDTIRRLFSAENDPNENWWDRSGYFAKRNHGKLGITLDLSQEEGRDLLKWLVALSDVVAENFSPRVMRNFGLHYEALRELKQDLIMISLSGFGQDGPHRDWVAYGMNLEAAAGLTPLTGYLDGPPMRTGMSWTDPVTGIAAAAAVFIALRHRDQTGEGQYIDLSEQECGLTFVGEAFLHYTLTGDVPTRHGNRNPYRAPQGCYPCAGDDAWVAVSVEDDSQWRGLCRAFGRQDWATDAGLLHLAGRRERHDELDQGVAAWTGARTHHDAARALRESGVACAPVLNAKDLLLDPHLAARRLFEWIDHPVIGRRPYPRPFPPLFHGRSFGARGRAPLLGEHTRSVLRRLLGLQEQQIDALEAKQVTGRTPIVQPPPEARRGIPLEALTRAGAVLRVEPGYRQVLERLAASRRRGSRRGSLPRSASGA